MTATPLVRETYRSSPGVSDRSMNKVVVLVRN